MVAAAVSSKASHSQRSSNALADAKRALLALAPRLAGPPADVLDRLLADLEATRFHAEHAELAELPRPMILGVLGGTGTGKSTLVNRLCGAADAGEGALTATSFRRTFTEGPVAVASSASVIPQGWLGLDHERAERGQLPARGRADELAVIDHTAEVTRRLTLIDTPDLDGDVPEHHAQADRVFRWAEALLFVTTPEKYQMTELLGYYRLAARYRLPALYVMNKVDDRAAADDWQEQLSSAGFEAAVFVVPRDDSALEASPGRDLASLRSALALLQWPARPVRAQAVQARCGDLAGRILDQLYAPLRKKRADIEEAKTRLEALVRPEAGVDVHPMTRQLQRRLQQQSVLYLMGPARLLDRLRSVPALVARLPRSTWDLFTTGKVAAPEATDLPKPPPDAPDFRRELMDGLGLVQSRISDVLAAASLPSADTAWRLDSTLAGDIATSELEELERWLENRWNAKPRDTRLLEKLTRLIPGGKNISRLSEAAPYLLAAACATTNTLFGPVDQVVIGGYLMTTWLLERMSNEVAAKTRETNRRIAKRFNELCERQVEHVQKWLDGLAPLPEQLDSLEAAAERLAADA